MREKVLQVLESNKGKFISGENLAGSLDVSRAAIWKAIDSLRKDGYKIKAVPNKGYSLENFNDVLTDKGIKSYLRADSRVKNVICFDKIDSTNNYAKKIALDGAENGTLIAANSQTAGRGRFGHSFDSPAGTGLYMSLILRPKFESSRFQFITIAAAVAVCLSIQDLCGFKPVIKWVNDIYLNGKKICGILTEAVTGFESGEIESVITGIGINITTEKFSGNYNAGALFSDNNMTCTRNSICAKIADYVMDFAENLESQELINLYRERSILTGKNITYMKGSQKMSAFVHGIDDNGGLIIINESGTQEILRSGEVFTVRENLS